MAKKKSSHQSKPASHKRLIFAGIAFVVVFVSVITTVLTVKTQELERTDREKFTALEVKIDEVRTHLNEVDNTSDWVLKKNCSKPDIKYYTDTAGTCTIVLEHQNNSTIDVNEIKKILNNFGNVEDEQYSEYSKKYYLNFSPRIDNINCVFYYVNSEVGTLKEALLNCGGPASQMYFSE